MEPCPLKKLTLWKDNNKMINYLFVFIGGGLGSLCRYGIAELLSHQNWTFPLATLLANSISCIILGALTALSLKGEVNTATRLMFMVGFCGGFSTFSTFSNETFDLFQTTNYAYGLLNIGGSVLICLICIYIGLKLVAS